MIPFDIRLPSWVTPGTKAEVRNFVTWDGAKKTALRVMHPVLVYPPAGGMPLPVPADFLGWLRSQSRFRVHLADVQRVKAGPYPATLLTITSAENVEGTFGCPRTNMFSTECFGPQPDFAIRMAVLRVRGTQLLIWLRDAADAKALTADSASFASTITGLRFPARQVAAATTAPAAP